MAHEVPILQTSFKATASLATKQYCAVKIDVSNDDSVVIAAANADFVVGILQNAPAAGTVAVVMAYGITKVLLGGAVTRDDALMAKSDGTIITRTGTNPSLGIALESGASGTYISVLLMCGALGSALIFAPISFQLNLASIATGNVFTFTPGFAGHIVSCSFVTNVPATTGAKAATLTPGIGATPTTGGAMALTSANQTPIGNEVKGTAITALNAFTNVQTITVIASAVTTFVEGNGTCILVLSA